MIEFTQYSEKKKEKKELKPIVHIPLGLWSFDRAFVGYQNVLGLPLDGFIEIAGPTSVGKSSLMTSLAGLISQKLDNKKIGLVDMEGFDPQVMSTFLEKAGFGGKVIYCNAPTNDEKSLDNLIDTMFDETSVGILDSIGAISPIAEKEGELGEANMGRRAKLLAQFSRKAIHMMNSTVTPKLIMMSNHLNLPLGNGGRGFITPGGETKKYLSTAIIRVKRKEEFLDGSYVIEGTVYKNRYGFKGKTFHIFMLAGYGIHLGLTAMYEGMLCDKVTRKGGVRIGDTFYGRLKEIITKNSREEDQSFFQPFHDVLKEVADAGNTDFDEEGKADESGEDTDIQD